MGIHGVAEKLRAGDSFMITGHLNPDGDSIGCMLALGAGLEQLGKRVSLQSHDPAPASCRWLPGVGRIVVVPVPEGEFDVAILLECATVQRSGFESVPAPVMVGIDHHPDYALEADANWADTSAAATAELIYDLLRELGCEITADIARLLLTGIVTDTGFFAYSATSPRTLEIAAELLRCGARTDEIMERVYRSLPAKRLDLMAELLGALRRECDGAFAILSIDAAHIRAGGYAPDLFEDMVNIPLQTDAVKIALLAREDDHGVWRCSMRAKGTIDVGAIAREHGGGGHRLAAGFRATGAFQDILRGLIPRVATALAQRPRS